MTASSGDEAAFLVALRAERIEAQRLLRD